MNHPKREQLLGYLLGALDVAERDAFEQQLADHPNWRGELDSLRRCLEPLEASFQDFEPPDDLAERTCAFVAERAESRAVTPANAPLVAAMAPPSATPRWSLLDVTVALSICLAATLLFLPAISNSRSIARLITCENNLREIGIALADYSDKAGAGRFPSVPAQGNRAFAGIYAPTLLEGGYLERPEVTLCPSSPIAGQWEDYSVPTLAQIDNATGQTLIALQTMASGSYGYNLGVVQDGRHSAPQNLGRPTFALMSDAPSTGLSTSLSINHGGRDYNILFEDGHIRQVSQRSVRFPNDDPFHNRRGFVEAGIDVNDAVIGPSLSPPFRNIPMHHRSIE